VIGAVARHTGASEQIVRDARWIAAVSTIAGSLLTRLAWIRAGRE
jgi:hypothetical protein